MNHKSHYTSWFVSDYTLTTIPDLKAGDCVYAAGRVGIAVHMGVCQNYGPFLDPYYNTAPNN